MTASDQQLPQRAWPLSWESDPRVTDGHRHDWEMVVVEPRKRGVGDTEAVTRCSVCQAPRCGDTFSTDPCLSIRHHRDPHIHESGRVRPVGA